VLCCDWNKYDISTIATASKDNGLRIWDMRAGTAVCDTDFRGHTMAVRKVQ
jgi:WD40 repeat protein